MKMIFGIIGFACVLLIETGCQSIPSESPFPETDSPSSAHGKTVCVLDGIGTGSEWVDSTAEVRIRFAENTAEYWIDGYQNDPSCRWELYHVRHTPHHCVFLCEAPHAEWFLSRTGTTVTMRKNVEGRKLPQSYSFKQEQ